MDNRPAPSVIGIPGDHADRLLAARGKKDLRESSPGSDRGG
jgi:hypothetical protein